MIIFNKLINLFPILFYPFLNIFILLVLGFGLTYLIIPKSLKSFTLWLSPWTTIITAIFYFVILSLFGLSVKQTIIFYFVFLLFTSIYVLIKIKPVLKIDIKENLILMVLMGAVLILNLSPLLKQDKMLTSVSLGNNDIIIYATAADYLKDHSISESFKIDQPLVIKTFLQAAYRWGSPMIDSFFLTMFNLQSYQYTYIAQAVLFALLLPLSYILLIILFGKSSLIALILIGIFTGFNVNLLYILYHDFFGQVLFWGIEILIFIFFYSYFNTQKIVQNKFNNYDFILGILITVLFFSYHEPAIFMFVPLGVFLFFKKRLQSLLKIAFISIITGAVSIIFSTIFNFKQAFMVDPNQPIGWQLFRDKIPFANPFEAMGFLSIHNFEPLPTMLAIILSLIIILVIIKGISQSKNKILTTSYVVVFFIFYYWTAFTRRNFFAYNRALTYTLPYIIVLFSIGIVSLSKNKKQKYFWSVIIVILISLELWSAFNLNRRFLREHLSVDKSFISISDLKNKNIKEPIYAEYFIKSEVPLWRQIWTEYFLYLSRISPVPTVFESGQFENKVPNNSLVLISKSTPWFSSPKIIFNDIVWSNDYYKLGHMCNKDDCLVKSKEKLNEINIGKNNFEDSLLISGWNITEGSTRWANAKESTLRLVAGNGYPMNLTIEALSLGKPQEMTVYLDDKLIGTIPVEIEWKKYILPTDYSLSFGVHNLKFSYSNGFRPMDIISGNLDSRILYVNFKEIKLE